MSNDLPLCLLRSKLGHGYIPWCLRVWLNKQRLNKKKTFATFVNDD